MRNEYFEMEFDDDRPAPLVCAEVKVREGKDGARSATWGNYRLISYPGAPPIGGGYSLAVNVPSIGFVVADDGDVPEHVELALCFALGIEYIP